MKIELNNIYNKDCIEFMKQMDGESVDLIIADPPYNIGKDYNNDSDKQTKENYLMFIKKQIEQYFRILKNEGGIMIYTGKQFNHHYKLELEKHFAIQNDIIWSYDSSGVQAKTKYGSLYEPIIFATKHQKKYTFNRDKAMIEAKTGAKRKLIDYRKNPPQPYNTEKVDGDVWNYTRVRYRMPEYVKHPTQKPLSICNRIVEVHSNKGELVYIPFAGSGSEIVSCINNNRNWIATELNEEYIEGIIKPRIEEALSNKEVLN